MTAKVGDVGTEIIVAFKATDCAGDAVVLDISDKTVLEISLCDPNEVKTTYTAAFTIAPCGSGDGLDGKASIFTLAAHFSSAGTWKAEGHVTKPSGEWITDAFEFEVEDPC